MKTARTIAVVDDEQDLRQSVSQWLQLTEFSPVAFESGEQALEVITPSFPGVVVSDIRMPGLDGMALLRRIQSVDPGLPVILMTGHGDVPMAVEAMHIGAFDFIEKPFDPERLVDICTRACERRQRTLESRDLRRELADESVAVRRLLGAHASIAALRDGIPDMAQADGHVLILGETGTGKSLIANALHACGPRSQTPMVTVNCEAIPGGQLEEMLFGGEAQPGKPLVDQAEGSTLVLENIEAMREGVQARLLELLNAADQASAMPNPRNLRVIAISSRLKQANAPGYGMRDDLFFRLAGLVVEVPPLRVRGEDILTLFTHYTRQFAEEYGCEAPVLDAADAANLLQAPWPGNVRQLINLAERSVLQTLRGEQNISALLIDDGFQAATVSLDSERPLKEHVEAFERMLIDHALRRHRGSVASVMAELALPRRTLNEKMAKYGLTRQDYL
ncbi:sigma-54-dependent transcriptional regulator [Amaricoccus macauensis]|uniref:sigma-54-dependent transcriptional regulator n=1 Tax=Amaricoccus macauensis TaxID=57001 RepID=UPI003C7BAB26